MTRRPLYADEENGREYREARLGGKASRPMLSLVSPRVLA
jgi:hypothetical protein